MTTGFSWLAAATALAVATIPTAVAQRDNQSGGVREAVSRMAKIGFAASPSFSPNGKRLAYISDLGGLPQVWMLPVEGGFPRQITAFDDPVGAVDWSPDGRWLALSVAPGGGMNQQVVVVSPDGLEVRRLTSGGKESNWLGVWDTAGKQLSVASNLRTPAAMDDYLLDVESGEMRLITRNTGTGQFADLSSDGRQALLSRLVGRGSNDLYLVDIETGSETLLTPHEGPGRFAGRIAPDGRTIFLSADKDRDLPAFGRIRLDSDGRPGDFEVVVERPDAELSSFRLDHAGRRAALLWNVAGRSELEILDLATTNRQAIEVPFDLASGLEFSPDDRLLAMSGSGAAAPSDVWIFDIAAGELRQLTYSPHAGVDLASMVRPELVRFPSHDGLEISGWLYRAPDVQEAGPWVLTFHGGPGGSGTAQLQQCHAGPSTAGHRRLRAQHPGLLGLRQALREPRQPRAAIRRQS